MNRRLFLVTTGAATGSLVLGVAPPRARASAEPLAPGPFVRIDPDGSVTVTCARAEMGQGARTAIAMLAAEELDADWNRVRVMQGDLDPRYGEQFAGGSAVVRTSWTPVRKAGAAARAMLVEAAARRWGVPAGQCRTESGRVLHPRSRRSLGYGTLVAEARGVAVPEDPPLKRPADYKLLGRGKPNLDHASIVTGTARFGIDTRVPGMLYASIERAPVFGGRVVRVDDAGAKAVAGVRHVVVIDADAIPAFGENNPRPANGVAVIATSTWAALQGRRALRVEWDHRGVESDGTDVMRAACVERAREPDRFARVEPSVVDRELRRSARTLEAVYETQLLAHAQMEPMNCVADVRPTRCEIWAPTQNPIYARTAAERITGLPASAITVHVTRMGGGFGRRFYADFAAEAIGASKAAGAPVQVVWTREDDLRHGFYRPAGYHMLRGALDGGGRITTWEHRLFNASRGHYLQWEAMPGEELNPGELSADDYPFCVAPVQRIAYSPVASRIPRGQWRAVENSSNVFVTQSFIDELAHLAGTDALAFRLDLIQRQREQVIIDEYKPARLAAVFRTAAERAGWGTPLPRRPGARDRRLLRERELRGARGRGDSARRRRDLGGPGSVCGGLRAGRQPAGRAGAGGGLDRPGRVGCAGRADHGHRRPGGPGKLRQLPRAPDRRGPTDRGALHPGRHRARRAGRAGAAAGSRGSRQRDLRRERTPAQATPAGAGHTADVASRDLSRGARMRSDSLSWGGVLARFVAALILVYATWNPEGLSYYHWAIAPIVGDAPPAPGSLALRFIAGILLAIGWVVFLQAARRSLGLAGAALCLALCAGVIWLLIEQRIVSPTSARAIGHIALLAVALVLAAGMSWSHVSRRLSGQLDTDEVN